MVAALTVGKPKFAEVEAEVLRLQATANELQGRFIELVAKDAEVFVPLSKAYGLPRETVEDQAHKARIMEACLRDCAEIPLEIMRTCGSALEVLERMEQIGTPIAISDVGCGALVLKGGLLSADLNVRVNTKLMKDTSKAAEVNAKAEHLIAQYVPLADAIYEKVQKRFD
jgi:formiminotetrahydrofolate cyclodeaminase